MNIFNFSDMWLWTCWRPSGTPTSRKAFSGVSIMQYSYPRCVLHIGKSSQNMNHFDVVDSRQFFAFSIYFCVSTVAFTLRHNQVHRLTNEVIHASMIHHCHDHGNFNVIIITMVMFRRRSMIVQPMKQFPTPPSSTRPWWISPKIWKRFVIHL